MQYTIATVLPLAQYVLVVKESSLAEQKSVDDDNGCHSAVPRESDDQQAVGRAVRTSFTCMIQPPKPLQKYNI